MNTQTRNLLKKGDRIFKSAEREVAGGEVLGFFACHHIKLAMVHYFQAYINSFNIKPPMHVTTENLYRMCSSIDGRFHELDLSILDCSCEKTDVVNHCRELEHIKACLSLAKSTKQLVTTLLD